METSKRWSHVSANPWWSEVFIVGGGPSLNGFNFTRHLLGRTVIAVNDAMLHLPFTCPAVISADRQWAEKRRSELLRYQGEKYLVLTEPRDILSVRYIRASREPGLSEDPEVIHHGGNSGYAALNLAVLMGAKRITLLGFDFGNAGQHWHAGYNWASPTDDQLLLQWARAFDSTIPQLKAAGVEVLNASPNSSITAFPKISLDRI